MRKCVQVFQLLLYLRDYLRTPLTILEGLANGRPRPELCYPSFDFCFEFLVNHASFLVRNRHLALMMDLKMHKTGPAVAM